VSVWDLAGSGLAPKLKDCLQEPGQTGSVQEMALSQATPGGIHRELAPDFRRPLGRPPSGLPWSAQAKGLQMLKL
jgi:hypothetical protein